MDPKVKALKEKAEEIKEKIDEEEGNVIKPLSEEDE